MKSITDPRTQCPETASTFLEKASRAPGTRLFLGGYITFRDGVSGGTVFL